MNRTTKTGADGSYSFTQLLPGTYTITQSQPTFSVDGLDTVGSQGGTSTVNNQIVATITQGTTGINNNFGERGRVRQSVNIRDFFTRSAARRCWRRSIVRPARSGMWLRPTALTA